MHAPAWKSGHSWPRQRQRHDGRGAKAPLFHGAAEARGDPQRLGQHARVNKIRDREHCGQSLLTEVERNVRATRTLLTEC